MNWFTFAAELLALGTARPAHQLMRKQEQPMAEMDRATARAFVEAGYMSLKEYIERFGSAAEPAHIDSPSTAPDVNEAAEPIVRARAATALECR
jgi:hypothetical protein